MQVGLGAKDHVQVYEIVKMGAGNSTGHSCLRPSQLCARSSSSLVFQDVRFSYVLNLFSRETLPAYGLREPLMLPLLEPLDP